MPVSLSQRRADHHSRATFLLLLAIGLTGVAHVAFLPPFEGFDEPSHWSYIQQLADTGQVPQFGIDKVSADVDAYPGPRVPGDGRVYQAFFAGPREDLGKPVARSYRPGERLNSESRHPPLYYLSLAPFYMLAKDWSWPNHLLLLRLVSWSFAFAGFAIGCRVSQRAFERMGGTPAAGLLIPAWPFLFPEFFPEMARLGNDGLCLLMMSIVWYFLLRELRNPDRRSALGLGIFLGLGLLTKVFFLPIASGVILLLAFAAFRNRDPRHVRHAIVIALVAAAVSFGWYLHRHVDGGSVASLVDISSNRENVGLLQILSQGSMPHEALHLLRGIAVMTASFAWAGTWSLAALPAIFTAPLVLLMAWATARWLLQMRRLPIEGIAPLVLVVPMILGLLYRQLLWVAMDPSSMVGTPGWYLHILCAPLSLVLALGWWPSRSFRLLAIYAVLFHAVCWATQLSFFSGCAYKPGARESLRLDPGSCLILPSHLAALGEPLLGGAALTGAAILGGMAVLTIIRQVWRVADPALPTETR